MNPFLWIAVPWLALGGGFVLVGVMGAIGQRVFVARATITSGRVVKIVTRSTQTVSGSSGRRRRRTRTEHMPEVEYTVATERYGTTPSHGAAASLWSEGDAIAVAYLAASPERAQVLGYPFQYRHHVSRLLWGLFFSAIGVFVLVQVLTTS